MTNKEKNKLIAEKLFGGCWHDVQFQFVERSGLSQKVWTHYCNTCKQAEVESVVRHRNRDFYNSHKDSELMLKKIQEKELSEVYIAFLWEIVDGRPNGYDFTFKDGAKLINANLEQKADAVVEVLKNA